MTEKEQLMEEFRSLHSDYLHVLTDYLPPDSRKVRVEESLQQFNKASEDFERNDLTVQALRQFITGLKETIEDTKYMKGTCEIECMRKLLREHAVVTSRLCEKKPPVEMAAALIEVSTSIIIDSIDLMLNEANNPKTVPWESRQRVHAHLVKAHQMLRELADKLHRGEVAVAPIASSNPTSKPPPTNLMN